MASKTVTRSIASQEFCSVLRFLFLQICALNTAWMKFDASVDMHFLYPCQKNYERVIVSSTDMLGDRNISRL